MSESQNIDKLSSVELDLVAWLFENAVIMNVLPCNAVEVRLDDPSNNLLNGGDGLTTHGGGGGRHYLKHAGDPEWAIVRSYDPEWTPFKPEQSEMAGRCAARLIDEERGES